MKPSETLDAVDRKLLNIIQWDFPLDPRPYAQLASKIETPEGDILARVERLKGEKIIRQISGIFDTRAIGYRSSLVAMQVPPERADEAAEIINAHPGVSHNYRRKHHFNLWFTVAVPPTSKLGLEGTVEALDALTRAESTRLLPTLKLYKIGVKLDMTGEQPVDAATDESTYSDLQRAKATPPTPRQIELLRVLQKDLPVVPRPFDEWAREAGVRVEELFAEAKAFQERGQMRRFAAVLYHRRAGFLANAMGVWAAAGDDARVDELGQLMASFNAVSHCYRRPIYPDWPYSIFTMIHGRTQEDCEAVLRAISEKTGITDYKALYSTKEYKKVRVPYFTPDYDEWEAQALATIRA